MRKTALALAAAALAAAVCQGQTPQEQQRYLQALQAQEALRSQPPYCEKCSTYCTPSRASALAPRPMAATQPNAPPTASPEQGTIGKVVTILEGHERRHALAEQRLNSLEAWRIEADAKLDRLLQLNGYAPGVPSTQPLLPQPPGTPGHQFHGGPAPTVASGGYAKPPAYIPGLGAFHYTTLDGVHVYDNTPKIDYAGSQGSAVYGSPVYAATKYLNYGRPLPR